MVFLKGNLVGRTFVVQTSSRYDSSSKLFMRHYRAQQIFTPGWGLRLYNARCVNREDHLNTYSVAAHGHWAMDAIAGVMIRCWGKLQEYLTNAFEPAHTSLLVGESILLRQKGMFVQHHQKKRSLLRTAPDWELFVDFDEQLKFPDYIVQTQLRTDMILVSNTTKQVIIYRGRKIWQSPTGGSSLNIRNLLSSVGWKDGGLTVTQLKLSAEGSWLSRYIKPYKSWGWLVG